MTPEYFRTLGKRDFENGAILDELERDLLALARERQAHADTRKTAMAFKATLERLEATSKETVAVVEAVRAWNVDPHPARTLSNLARIKSAMEDLAAKEREVARAVRQV